VYIVSNLNIILLISQTDIVSIITNYVSVMSIADDVTVKKNIVSLKFSTNIITSITARPDRLAVVLVIMSVSTLITAVILYIYYWPVLKHHP